MAVVMPDCDSVLAVSVLQENSQLIWAPIRHHSPVCSWQLLRLIKQQKPDVILIEAPSDAQSLLLYLQHPDTKPPVALYLYCHFKERQHSQSGFIPFAEMSPEWNALKAAGELGLPCEFIDLPYKSQWNETHQDQCDYLIYDNQRTFSGQYVDSLLSSSSCYDFDQWWDRHFEGQYLTHCDDFFKQTLLFGRQMRGGLLATDLETQYREQHMASRIATYLNDDKRVLVVCGAYHCLGVNDHLMNPTSLETCLLKPSLLSSGQYVVPYSLSRLSHQSYGASLRNSDYYHQWWLALKASHAKQQPQLSQYFHSELTTKLMSFLQRKSVAVAMPQLVDIVVIAEQLAQLRDIVAGRSEFREAAILALDKSPSGKREVDRFELWLDEFFCNTATGTLPSNIPCAPTVIEFRQQCIAFKLPHQAMDGHRKKELAIYRNAKHRELSQWLHRLAFIDIPYAVQTAGPNFFNQTQLTRVREKWHVQWQIESETCLVQMSHLGSSIEELVNYKLHQQLNSQELDGSACVLLLLGALQMGMNTWLTPLLEQANRQIKQEDSLFVLSDALDLLLNCQHTTTLLDHSCQSQIQRLISDCYLRLCARLPCAISTKKSVREEADLLANMAKVVKFNPSVCQPQFLLDAVISLSHLQLSFQLQGVCATIQLLLANESQEKILTHQLSAIGRQCYLTPDALGDFCYGIGLVDLSVYTHFEFIAKQLDQLMLSFNDDMFLQVLPAMRRAFMLMTPSQIGEFSRAKKIEEWTVIAPPDIESLTQATQLNNAALDWLKKWGIEHE